MNEMDVVQAVQYASDSPDEAIAEKDLGINGNERTLKKRKSKFWVKEAIFDKPGEVKSSVGNEWSKRYTNYTQKDKRLDYRCKKAKRRGPHCSANIYLLYHTDSDTVTVYKTEADHDHHVNKVTLKQNYMPARDLQPITKADLNKFKNKKWTIFNQFKKSFDIWCIELENDSGWKK